MAKFCKNCGTELYPYAEFCGSCGAPTQTPSISTIASSEYITQESDEQGLVLLIKSSITKGMDFLSSFLKNPK